MYLGDAEIEPKNRAARLKVRVERWITVESHLVMANKVMACVVMAYVVMFYVVMAYIVMAYIVMALNSDDQ